MRFISLFSGIGGLDLGLEWAGWDCVAQVEKDDYCWRVLEKHWPDVARFKDVRNVGRENLPPADAIVGGFPCQPHSVAGKRKGKRDDRNLWPEYFRIIRDIKPKIVVGENVPNIVNTMLDSVLSDLESEGYTCWTFDIPACGISAKHRRHRIFIVAVLGIPAGNGSHRVCKTRGSNGKEPLSWRPGKPEGKKESEVWEPAGTGHVSHYVPGGCGGQNRDGGGWPSHHVGNFWTTEPDVGRVAHGVPNRVERIKGLGNAVVPQVAYFVGATINEWLKEIA